MTQRRTITTCLLALCMAIVGCASQSSAGTQQPAAADTDAGRDLAASASPPPTATDPSPVGSPPTTGGQPQAQRAGPDATAGTSSAGSGSPSASPTGPPPEMDFPRENNVPVSATVEPACVPPGGTATLIVETEPEAGLAYHARYAGNEGGADPPAGESHGGNDSGFADQDGRYRDTWVVSTGAPSGPARVDVIVSTGHEQWGYTSPTFAVADDEGRC